MQLASYYYSQDHFLKTVNWTWWHIVHMLQGGGRWVTRTGVAGQRIWTWPCFGKLSSKNVSDPVSPRHPLAGGTLSFILLGNCGISILVLFLRYLGRGLGFAFHFHFANYLASSLCRLSLEYGVCAVSGIRLKPLLALGHCFQLLDSRGVYRRHCLSLIIHSAPLIW